ncbi:MAG: fibrinogen-like YCDxxxxGGGW domain-containing protein [Candidatus Aureabacteria bacterium]|nr:fibrinogen-like YCDxxxxGGGW domain-containing protein [Candidatus Auribacterota bacterium]
MKKLITVALSLIFMVGLSCVAVAGSLDSPGAPSAGSGMYTLQNLYDFLTSGTALTVQTSFQEPTSGPGSTMRTTKQIGDAVATSFAMCDATADKVASGTKFFSTVPGRWGVQTGTLVVPPTPTPYGIYASCKAILTATPSAGNGTYTIDPDGSGGNAPFSAYCDMTNDGGGWTLVVRMKGTNRLHIDTASVGTLTAPDQADTAKLSDASINAISSEIYRLSCGNTTIKSCYFDAAGKDFNATSICTAGIMKYKTTYTGEFVTESNCHPSNCTALVTSNGQPGTGAKTIYGAYDDYFGCILPGIAGDQDGYLYTR